MTSSNQQHSRKAPEPVVSARSLEKTFRDFWRRPVVRAVRGISFEVMPGEIFGLLGPNGSGKSTTLRMALGLLHPSGGELSVFGRSPRDVSSKARIGFLPEESCIYPFLTARETLVFYGSLFDLPGRERSERVEQLLEMTGLRHAANRRVGEFSKGMLRRIGLAQALINDPDLIILDEPTSGLDPVGCRQVKDLLLALAARGKTILLSSHLLADMENVCRRIAIMADGVIVVQGQLDELLEISSVSRFSVQAEGEQLKALSDLLRERIGVSATLDHPRRSLEQFFLEKIGQVQAEPGARSGVAYVEKVAPFLLGGRAKDPDAAPNLTLGGSSPGGKQP